MYPPSRAIYPREIRPYYEGLIIHYHDPLIIPLNKALFLAGGEVALAKVPLESPGCHFDQKDADPTMIRLMAEIPAAVDRIIHRLQDFMVQDF